MLYSCRKLIQPIIKKKKQTNRLTSVGKNIENLEPSYIADEIVKGHSRFERQFGSFFKREIETHHRT